MQRKRLLSLVVSLCVAAGAVSYGSPMMTQTITTQAAVAQERGCYFNAATGVLALRGEISREAISDFGFKDYVKSIIAENGTVLPQNCSNLFFNYLNCTSIDLSKADTSNVTNMSGMFQHCRSLEKLDVSGFDTSNVTSMNWMFYECQNLRSLDLSGFDTGNVTDMSSMFFNCSKMNKLVISGFNTSKVNDMGAMFSDCSELWSIDVSGFDTSNVSFLDGMFCNCNKLGALDLSGFDTSKVITMSGMFKNCKNLKTITLGNNFKEINADASLSNQGLWGIRDGKTVTIAGGLGEYAVIKNVGTNTYSRAIISFFSLSYPTNINVEYIENKHQVKFTWDKVDGADRYSVAVYQSGKWRIQSQDITDTVYYSPENLTPGKKYKVAIAARVYGVWDTENAIEHAVTVTVK